MPGWIFFASVAGLFVLGLMLAGGYYFERLRSRGVVLAAIMAAFLVAIGFSFYAVHMAWAPGLRPLTERPESLTAAGIAIVVALCNGVGAVNAWRAIHDPEVRRAYRA